MLNPGKIREKWRKVRMKEISYLSSWLYWNIHCIAHPFQVSSSGLSVSPRVSRWVLNTMRNIALTMRVLWALLPHTSHQTSSLIMTRTTRETWPGHSWPVTHRYLNTIQSNIHEKRRVFLDIKIYLIKSIKILFINITMPLCCTLTLLHLDLLMTSITDTTLYTT